jgi:hypothetical protein
LLNLLYSEFSIVIAIEVKGYARQVFECYLLFFKGGTVVKNKHLIVVSALVSVLVSACVTIVGPGSRPADTPPQIVTDAERHNVWDNPGAFGPVPANLQAKGDSICRSGGLKRAIGYHPQAKRLDGRPFDGGGFLCRVDD